MKTKTNNVETTIDHPLEDIFDIERHTTVISKTETTTEIEVSEIYDDKDREIESQLLNIHDLALDAFTDISSEVETVEGKYKARLAEVANQSLNTALNAIKEQATVKQNKDKNNIAKGKLGNKTVNNNLIVADRNDILKSIIGNNVESTTTNLDD